MAKLKLFRDSLNASQHLQSKLTPATSLLCDRTPLEIMALPFIAPSRHGADWFPVGLASSFPDVNESGSVALAEQQQCENAITRNCKVFLAPDRGDGVENAVELSGDPSDQVDATLRKGDQVLVFQYRQKFYAMDNVSVPSCCRLQEKAWENS